MLATTNPSSASILLVAAVLLSAVAQGQSIPTPTEGAGFLPSPIAQPSIGGSAGPFSVSSLSRSSSYNFQTGALPQTTTYQAPAASYGSVNRVQGSYNTNTATSNIAAQVAASVSGATPARSSQASSTASQRNAALSMQATLGWTALALPMVTILAALVGGTFVM